MYIGRLESKLDVKLGERTGQACQDRLENGSVGVELTWGQDLHSPHFYFFG